MAVRKTYAKVPEVSDPRALENFLRQTADKVNTLCGFSGENPYSTNNPPQPDPGNIDLKVENLESINSKLNEILEILRNSNIISR